ncbi:phosphate ABC transporter ATP-binding protein [Campylobacter sp. RM12916]|nr:phosphate ABC transporter ATP-binding protein [Campylobacter sp. RM12916]
MKIKARSVGLNLYYGDKQALYDVNVDIYDKKITALIGASGCGKSTFLRCFNRMNDLIDGCKIGGLVEVNSQDIYASDIDVVAVRRRVGMVFQQPNPFAKSIYDNISYAPLMHGIVKKGSECDELVERCLKSAGLFKEVKDKLKQNATSLSGGQQQRLCIARAIAVRPEIILMDEPTSALDPISTSVIEELMRELRDKFSIVVVTHNMQQAQRVADYTAFFHLGELVEYNKTDEIFNSPQKGKTKDYIKGRFG